MHPAVVAANNFRKAMKGEAEQVFTSDNGAVIEVARGNKGIVLVNFSTKEEKFKVATTLADGEYTDKVSGNTIKVTNGEIKGKIAPLATYVIY
jgi:alpha-amylase